MNVIYLESPFFAFACYKELYAYYEGLLMAGDVSSENTGPVLLAMCLC